VDGLVKYFPVKKGIFGRTVGHVQAVDGVSFEIGKMETFGLVGESGCGKTTAGRTLLRLIEPTAGRALYQGRDIFKMDKKSLRSLRRHMQIIFQDPYSSLNPRMTVENIVGDAMEIHGIARGEAKRERVKDLLVKVGLQASYITRYPHEFSGGQRQRIGIARALAPDPSFIVCDEAVSALDVSIQAQVINLLMELQEEFELSYLFIAHDLAVVRHLSDRVAVMYLGQIVEQAKVDDLFNHPAHPYTKALLSAIPVADPRRKTRRIILEGDVPTPINPPSGCRFHTRCPAAYRRCTSEAPAMLEVEPSHWAACHLYTEPQVTGLPLDEQLAVVAEKMGLDAGPSDDRAQTGEDDAETAGTRAETDEDGAETGEQGAEAGEQAAKTGARRLEDEQPATAAAAQHVGPSEDEPGRPTQKTPLDLELAWSHLHDSLSGEWPAVTPIAGLKRAPDDEPEDA
jgi:oligopeptide/dipeptide ABC transporter ATP-binding protein